MNIRKPTKTKNTKTITETVLLIKEQRNSVNKKWKSHLATSMQFSQKLDLLWSLNDSIASQVSLL